MKLFGSDKGHLYGSVEEIRGLIRYYTGALGDRARGKIATREFFAENLPKAKREILRHYNVPKANKNILLLCDIHVPYHDSEALGLAIQYGLEQNVDTIILDGDFTDFYAASRFETDYTERNLQEEIYQSRDILYTLRELFPKALIVFKWGNHEVRWGQWLMKNELKTFTEFQLSALLHFKELDIVEVFDKATIWAGKLAILHGHEHKYGMIAPVNPARGLFLRTKQSAIMGHVHRASEHTEKAHDGKLIGCWSVGCLCQLSPEYMPYNNYGHGFAHILIENDGMFTVMNKKIINGKIY